MVNPYKKHSKFFKTALFSAVLFMCAVSSHVYAQMPEGVWNEQTQSVQMQEEQGERSNPEMDPIFDEAQEEISIEMMDKPVVRIRMLNKITAATRTYDLDVDKPVSFDELRIQPRACRKAPPIAKPESASFLEIWEVPANDDKPRWIFSGWMFASSPGLSAMDHPVYDVWVLDCLDQKGEGNKTSDDAVEQEEKAQDEASSE